LESVGANVENPELYTYLSGRENLMQIARIRNIPKLISKRKFLILDVSANGLNPIGILDSRRS
jgi:ABC-type multidrug transport system ATPase subunit